MTMRDIWVMPFQMPMITWDKEGETGGGGDTGAGDTGAAGETGGEGGDTGDTGIANADDQNGGDEGGDDLDVAVDGGTAEGQDNSGEGEGDGDKDGDGEGENPDVPETYEFKNLPEGMEVDEGLAEGITPVFRELGLNQEQADKLVGAYAAEMQRQAEASVDAVRELVTGWVNTAKADKEIGHANWQGSIDAANAVIREFGTPELVSDVMVGQGMGNHPEMIRMLARIGKAIGDDSLVTGKATDTGEASPEAVWYGATTPNSKKG